ncbi:hypothetical protein BCR32DRAFT_327661 [Anaeromyces robustus]|uniref:Uncharacterized protein n=1 Tax=Anaeromyces robustus TaxID=1754192 RepID=A0A1Y1X442_9FUNG|nr:hypothetical protein BCR32DRAFT_327661 [Anaeromyces robustus]|eukprot:ORX80580.1 hypothetical protein BCR32DRAFT_327661 [Anaeromyces robustus]
MSETYETKISTKKWIIYDLPGNAGWILYLVRLILIFAKKAEFLNNKGILCIIILSFIPAILMIIDVIELINEKINKLDRILSKTRLYRGFGALSLGGLLGIIITIIGILYGYCITIKYDLLYLWFMFFGSILALLFSTLIFVTYKKKI